MSRVNEQAALDLAARGWPILPLKPAGKLPLTAHGVKDATTDERTILHWFERWPDANIGVACGEPGPTVLDIDDPGQARDITRRLGGVPQVATARGSHYYFQGADQGTVPLGYGELRGLGSYVVAPPSIHETGKTYTWLLSPNGKLPAVPGFLARVAKRTGKAGTGKAKPRETVPPGSMYEYLLDKAIRLVRAGETDEAALATALDGLFEAKRDPAKTYNGGQHDTRRIAEWAAQSEIARKESEPVEDPVPAGDVRDLAELLEHTRRFVLRFMVLPSGEVADLLALWIAHTHAIDAAFATPYLRVVSAAPSCGKSLLLEILASVGRNGWYAVVPSLAVLYRKVDAYKPTLLLDEFDNYDLAARAEALAILNEGYKRGAKVDRCKENGDLQQFDAYCAKAYAGLDRGNSQDTLLSRSITIRLEPKVKHDKVDMWIWPLVHEDANQVRDDWRRWAAAADMNTLGRRRPDLPDCLFNRSAEVWWALLAVADLAGGDWPARARRAAERMLTGGDEVDEKPDMTQLLTDIRDAFGIARNVSSEDLVHHLNRLQESPWGSRRRGDGLDQRGLASMLRPLRIRSKTVRIGDMTAKGYSLEQFDAAFARYLETSVTSVTSTPQRRANVTDVTDVTDNPGGKGT